MMRRLALVTAGGAATGSAAYCFYGRLSSTASVPRGGGALIDGAVDLGAHSYDYDLVVIGGGSGGLAAAKAAAASGAKVALCDFVVPTVHKTTWGLGGTCVNVGCIPKKLMHQSALLRESQNHDAKYFGAVDAKGAEPPATQVDWSILQQNVEDYIRSLNFGYLSSLRSKEVKYLNAFASFVEPHVLECKTKKGEVTRVSARRFILAPGGRPSGLGIPGEEHAITSDDLFRLKRDPKKTLVVGGGYIALECAGFLHGIGRSATVMMRSVPLRGMDRDMALRAAGYMERCGIPMLMQSIPTQLEKLSNGQIKVTYTGPGGVVKNDVFDTVLMAVGRKAQVAGLGLDKAGVALHDGKIEVDEFNRTTTPHVYALGDAIRGGLELTPVAIKAGNALADRLYRGGRTLSDMSGVPTTVFTPLEYSFVGLSEADAEMRVGINDVEVYHQEIQPLEWALPHRSASECYTKMIVQKSTDKVLGFHLLSPNSGEIMQGVAVALKAGATKAHFDECIGIHPTIAETMTTLKITKSSGESASSGGGC